MIIIEKSQLAAYRIAVAKIAFLKTYNSEFSFVRNLAGSSMLVRKLDTSDADNGTICVAVLQQPSKGTKASYPVTTYYQKGPYQAYLRKKERKNGAGQEGKYEVIELLPPAFDEYYDMDLETAITHPDKFFNNINEIRTADGDILSVFSGINGLLTNADEYLEPLKEREHWEKFPCLYKYLTAETFERDIHGTRSGSLSFSHPNKFNDPFDCNCFFSNGNSAADKFRILCLAGSNDNILMWSHYGEEHKGYCCEYWFQDIYNAIANYNDISGLCIWSSVKYTDKRPKQFSPHSNFTWTDINDYVNAAFSKFKDWEYEKETRFVIISNDPNLPQFPIISLPTPIAYRGCNNQNKKSICTRKMVKDPIKYALIPK